MRELPSGWTRAWVGDVLRVIRGISFPSEAKGPDSDGKIACLRTKNVQAAVDWKDLVFVPTMYVKNSDQYAQPGDILVSAANSYELVGKVAYIECAPRPATIGAFISILRPTRGIDSKFVYFQLAAPKMRKSIRATASTTTNISNISLSKCLDFEFVLPPLAEQRRIVAEIEKQFTRLEAAATTLEEGNQKLRTLRSHFLANLFTSPRYPRVKLGTICRVVRGASPRPAGSPRFFGGPVPWITVGSLTKAKGPYLRETTETLTEEGRERSRYIDPDTLLLTNSGATLGVPRITKIGGCINDGSVALLNLDETARLFLYYFLCTQTKRLRQINQGAAQPNLNTSLVKEIVVPNPPRSEQIRIIDDIERSLPALEATDLTIEASRMHAHRLRQAILAKAFSGQLVPQDPNDEPASVLLERIRRERNPSAKPSRKRKRPELVTS